MTFRVFSLVTIFLVVVLVALSFHHKAPSYRLSLGSSFHIGLQNGGAQHWEPSTRWILDPRIAFYNDAQYGPYRGSIIGLVGDKYPIDTGFGDWWGIYYRHFKWQDGSVLWTLTINLWHFFNVTSITLILILARYSNHTISDLLFAMTIFALAIASSSYLRALHPLGITCLLLILITAVLTKRLSKFVIARLLPI